MSTPASPPEHPTSGDHSDSDDSDESDSDDSAVDDPGPQRLTSLRYEQAASRVSGQRDSLNELRSRTGLLISAAAISTSFLGSVGAKGKHGFPLEFLWALAPFGLSILLLLVILLPLLHWRFGLESDKILDYTGTPIDAAMSGLARVQEENRDWNGKRLGILYWLFTAAALAMLWSIIAWIAVIE